jgi:hypothetical protein
MSLYLFTLTPAELGRLARVVDPGDVVLSACRTRALVAGASGPMAASALPGALALQTACLTRAEAVLEWLS